MKSASAESIRHLLLSTSSREAPSPPRVMAVGIFSAIVLLLSEAAAVGGIFKTGVWVGMLGVVALFVIIGSLATLLSK